MLRIFLRLLNAPALILIVALGMAIQTSLFASQPLSYIQPDVALITVIWIALRRGFTEGGALTLILASIAESHSAAPQGVLLCTYMAIFLLVRISSRVLVLPHHTSLVLLAIACVVAWKLLLLAMVALLGGGSNQWRHTLLYLSPGAIVNGLLSFWAFRWLEKFDWATFKNPRAHQALDDEYRPEGEGI